MTGITLSGLHGIDIMQCTAKLNASSDSGENCGKGFDLDINFDASSRGNSLVEIDGMNMGNGTTLKIEGTRNDNNVVFNQFIGLVDGLTALSGQVERRYTARLYASGPAVIGDTEKNIILRFNYH
ncbi:hypothetical protein [Pectobacterium odoriferum]|uniref:hypothetical protein n=1 Tax=Pectobacterium odoriferum TaxID=78398 RepID=UPI000D44B4AD|nr:hypothetical protein [Pectobacterium odoriferum]POD98878.1 hypothetical protein BVY05_19195 [Pectobacterium odoriferum]